MKRKKDAVTIILVIILVAVLTGGAILTYALLRGRPVMDSYQKQIETARQYYSVKDYDEAIKAYYRAIDIDDTRDTAYLGLAGVYEETGDLNFAIYILEQGERRANSQSIKEKLNFLVRKFIPDEKTVSNSSDEIAVNTDFLIRASEYTYLDYKTLYMDNAGITDELITSVSGETITEGQLTRIEYGQAGISFYYVERAPIGEVRPTEIHLSDLRFLFGGMQGALTLDELTGLVPDGVQKTTVSGMGDTVYFNMLGCQIWIACDSDGTITSRYAKNCIIPADNSTAGTDTSGRTTETHTLTGVITNAVTGGWMSGARVTLYGRSYNTVYGETFTGSDGTYTFEDLDSGFYYMKIEASGFVSEEVEVYVGAYSDTSVNDFTISPELNVNEIRIVLTWGASPTDLDSHLFLPDGHVFFADPTFSRGGSLVANLDVDDRNGYGPETTTIYDAKGELHFMVEDFTRSGGIGSSGAQVKIYVDNESAPIVIDATPEAGNGWDVCYIRDGEVEIVNRPAEVGGGGL